MSKDTCKDNKNSSWRTSFILESAVDSCEKIARKQFSRGTISRAE